MLEASSSPTLSLISSLFPRLTDHQLFLTIQRVITGWQRLYIAQLTASQVLHLVDTIPSEASPGLDRKWIL